MRAAAPGGAAGREEAPLNPRPETPPLRRGIVPVLQTPFDDRGSLDGSALERLVEEAVAAGASGLLVPAVASEVSCLRFDERRLLLRRVAGAVAGRVPIIAGASAPRPREAIEQARLARSVGAAACLVAVPPALYREPRLVVPFFREVAEGAGDLPLMVQDLDFSGPGLGLDTIRDLVRALPSLAAFKIESVPAGPKYTAVREICGEEIFIAGGWSIGQMIEALDRGVDAMIPESAMVRVYSAIDREHREGRRPEALRLFHRLQPVIGFTHQDLEVTIAFAKRLLVRKGVFATERMRLGDFRWDRYNGRIAEELVAHYLELEASLPALRPPAPP